MARSARLAPAHDTITLCGEDLVYEVTRANRTTLEIQFEPGSLLVRCPASMKREDIRSLLVRHGERILGIRARPASGEGGPPAKGQKRSLLYRGKRCPVVARRGTPSFELVDGKFVVRTATGAHADKEIEAAYRKWLKRRAMAYLPRRAVALGDRHGIWPKKVTVSEQAGLWGSATSGGRISLNSMLLILPPRLIDYVILHELCHILYPNHSGRFWRMLAGVYPGVERARRDIKKYADEL